MADRKISDLTALTTPASGDYLPIVDISEASAANKNKRITIEELLRGAPDGTAGAPGIGFESDPNTGIYSPGADQVAISTGGSGRLFVDASGNVLIGATGSASRLLTVNQTGTTGGEYGIRVSQQSATSNAIDITIDSANGVSKLFQKSTIPLVFGTNDTERLRITSAGLVGVGTSSPLVNTHIYGATNADQYWDAGGTVRGYAQANTTNANFTFGTTTNHPIRFITNATTALTIDTSQRVGIGTTSDAGSSKLFVAGDATAGLTNIVTLRTASGNSYGLQIQGNNTNDEWRIQNYYNAALAFGTSNTERARIDSSGRLLVGTSDGSGGVSKLVVQGASNGSAVGVAQISYNGLASAALAADTDIGYLRFTDQGSNSGVFAQITATADATTGANDYPGRLVFSTTADGASSPTERMRIGQSGQISFFTSGNDTGSVAGINFYISGGAGRANWFNPAGATRTVQYFYYSTTEVGSIAISSTATAYNTSSDYRLKENVTAVTDGITRLQQLKPSRFNFITDPTKTVDGFIAHEVQTVVPEAITGEKDAVDDDGNPQYQGIDQSKLVPLLTAALQEAVAKIESLEARLTAAGI